MLRVLLAAGAALVVAATAFLVPTLWGKPWSIDHFFLRETISLALDHPMLLSYARVLEPYDLDYYSVELEDFRAEASKAELERARVAREGLRAFEGDALTGEQRLSAAILAWFLDHELAGEPFLEHDYPINAFNGSHDFIADFLLNQHQVNDAGDAETYLARLAAFDEAVAQLQRRVADAAERGIVPPRFILERVREGLVEFQRPETVAHPLVAKLARRAEELDEVTEQEGAIWVERAVRVMETQLLPAYQGLEAQVAALARDASDDAGVWKLPDGQAYYRWALRGHTTTSLSPDEVHEIGQREVERIHAQMRGLFAERGTPTDDPVAGLQALGREPAQLYPDDDTGRAQILEDYQRIITEIEGRLPEWFERLPRAGVRVERVPAFREAGSAGAYYNPPPLDGSKPGVFYKNLAQVSETARFGMRTLAVHEAVPGHHLQIALAMESEGLPLFRRFLPFTAFVEGWALYSERLASEVGLFPTPEDRLGQLQAENFRAVRLIVDTGLHAKRWTRERAIDTMVSLTGMPRSDVTREVERYVVAPGQACAYKIGQLQILELRARAREALGDRFDLRAFHTQVLEGGSVPLEVLETEVEAWIERAGS